MSVTVQLAERRSVRFTNERIEARPPDRVAVSVEGVVTMTEGVLSEFEGATLRPVRVDISVTESRTVGIDVAEEASLRLQTVNVGIETPDADDLSTGVETIRSSSDDGSEPTDAPPGAIAFTVEGEVVGVPEESLESISDGSPTLESITFAVEDPVRGDGGSDGDVLVEFDLLGYGIVVHRNGAIDVGTRAGAIDV